MSSPFNESQCQRLKCAWQYFSSVINKLPVSDTTILLIFHANNLLDKLAHPPVDRTYVETVTERVNILVRTSPVVLDIDDMILLINQALTSTLTHKLTKTD